MTLRIRLPGGVLKIKTYRLALCGTGQNRARPQGGPVLLYLVAEQPQSDRR